MHDRPRLFDPDAPAALGLAGYQPIETWHVCISGFRQEPGHPSGIQALWSKLRRAHQNGRVAVELREWDADWDALAELIWNFRRPPTRPLIFVHAYSWGAGWGFVRLAHALARRGLSIEDAVLCDPVYCPPFWTLAWQALSPRRTIRVPHNVARVHAFHQVQSLPRGHRVIAVDEQSTTIYPSTQLSYDHIYIDDADEFHELSCTIARAAAVPHDHPAGAYHP